VGLRALSSLINVACTCRALRDTVLVSRTVQPVLRSNVCQPEQNDERQSVWYEIHRNLYDNPKDACAFLEPRQTYDWKTTVIDRHRALRFFGSEIAPHDPERDSTRDVRWNRPWCYSTGKMREWVSLMKSMSPACKDGS